MPVAMTTINMADSDNGLSQQIDNKVSVLNSIWSGTSMQTKLALFTHIPPFIQLSKSQTKKNAIKQ